MPRYASLSSSSADLCASSCCTCRSWCACAALQLLLQPLPSLPWLPSPLLPALPALPPAGGAALPAASRLARREQRVQCTPCSASYPKNAARQPSRAAPGAAGTLPSRVRPAAAVMPSGSTQKGASCRQERCPQRRHCSSPAVLPCSGRDTRLRQACRTGSWGAAAAAGDAAAAAAPAGGAVAAAPAAAALEAGGTLAGWGPAAPCEEAPAGLGASPAASSQLLPPSPSLLPLLQIGWLSTLEASAGLLGSRTAAQLHSRVCVPHCGGMDAESPRPTLLLPPPLLPLPSLLKQVLSARTAAKDECPSSRRRAPLQAKPACSSVDTKSSRLPAASAASCSSPGSSSPGGSRERSSASRNRGAKLSPLAAGCRRRRASRSAAVRARWRGGGGAGLVPPTGSGSGSSSSSAD